MKIDVRIKQSEIRVRSGIKLVFLSPSRRLLLGLWMFYGWQKFLSFLFCFSLSLHYLNIGMPGDLRGSCNIY
ncbi:hypothetical protein [Xanthomonas sacchari]|uniref:hypothetical protein n=1 Tax=Xanthomonas sacchari TaxID=56458 RepID=UPI00225E50C4|nr:hypothetical protein [Xanthomonas sacchari]